MTRHTKPETLLASVDVVERIVRLLKPGDEKAANCRRDVAKAIKVIAEHPTFVTPGIIKARLNDIAVKMQAAQKAIDKLPLPWRDDWHRVSNQLTRARQLAGVARPTTPSRSMSLTGVGRSKSLAVSKLPTEMCTSVQLSFVTSSARAARFETQFIAPVPDHRDR
jgi:hypothetical protein